MSDLDLTPEDRCDVCGARAWVRTFITRESSLQWCGHCFTAREQALAGYLTVDHRDRILPTTKEPAHA